MYVDEDQIGYHDVKDFKSRLNQKEEALSPNPFQKSDDVDFLNETGEASMLKWEESYTEYGV